MVFIVSSESEICPVASQNNELEYTHNFGRPFVVWFILFNISFIQYFDDCTRFREFHSASYINVPPEKIQINFFLPNQK